jgi:hypothetical protein
VEPVARNPYAPPSAVVADRDAGVVLAAFGPNSKLPVVVGVSALLSLAITLMVPLIVTWQSRNLLRRAGAEEALEMMVDINLSALKVDRIISIVCAATAIIGSVLMLRQIPAGRVLAIFASALWLAGSGWALYSGNHILPGVGPIVRGAWWGVLLVLLARHRCRPEPQSVSVES